MYRDRCNLRISLRKLAGEKHVRKLRLPITPPRPLLLQGCLVKYDSPVRRCHFPYTRHVNDAHVGAWLRGCLEEHREKQLGQQRVPDVIGAELDLIALLSEAVRCHHDAGIVDQYVEALLARLERRGGGCNRREGRQVEREVFNCGRGACALKVGDGSGRFGGRARGEVDARGRVGGKVGDGLLA